MEEGSAIPFRCSLQIVFLKFSIVFLQHTTMIRFFLKKIYKKYYTPKCHYNLVYLKVFGYFLVT